MKRWKITGIFFLCLLFLSGCSAEDTKENSQSALQNGCYTAQMKEYSHGWREYVTITVENGEIVSTEYNAENKSGFIKSWDTTYMKNMKAAQGTYPNEYTRFYAAQLTGQTEAPEIDMLSGASSSGGNFVKLSAAVVEQAKQGDSSIAYVEGEKE